MNPNETNDSRALILSQLSGPPVDRVTRFAELIREFIERVEGFIVAGIEVSILVRSNGYEVIEIGVQILNKELLQIENDHGAVFERRCESFLRQLKKLKQKPSREEFYRIQREYLEFQ